jgi:lysozyme family protein
MGTPEPEVTDYFPAAFAIVVGLEGGYTDDPADPGGATKYGISQRAYPGLDIANLTLSAAQDIYREDYWPSAAGLPWEMALCVFDCAVNQGTGAAHVLRIQATDAAHFMALRALRYTQTDDFDKFGQGWLNRLFSIMKQAQVVPHE